MNLDARFDRYLARELSAEELQALEADLERDPALRRAFAAYFEETALLIQAARHDSLEHESVQFLARSKHRPASVVWFAAAAVLLLVAVGGVLYATGVFAPVTTPGAGAPPAHVAREPEAPPVPRANLVRCQGQVQVTATQRTWTAQVGERLEDGSRLDLGENADAVVRFTDGTELTLDQGFSGNFDAQAGIRWTLSAGRAGLDVPPQPSARPLRVVTPHLFATVLGTRFEVDLRADTTEVRVQSGVVRCQARGDQSLAAYDVQAGVYALGQTGQALRVRPQRVSTGLAALYDFNDGPDATVIRNRVSEPGTDLFLADGKPTRGRPGFGVKGGMLTNASDDALRKALRENQGMSFEAWVRLPRQPPEFDKGILGLLPFVQKDTLYNLMFMMEKERYPEQTEGIFHHYVFVLHGSKDLMRIYRNCEVVGERKLPTRQMTDFERDVMLQLPFLYLAGDRSKPWSISYGLVALYRRALTEAEIRTNYEAGLTTWNFWPEEEP
jgi:ferric-dicitrate binding protein FerR (iron transport regulator)